LKTGDPPQFLGHTLPPLLFHSFLNIEFPLLGYPIYAWKGETEEDFWWCIEKCINAPGWNPNMVNYWGNVTLYIDVRKTLKLI
jgi:S-adenosylhomocysteine hydrolase